MAGTFVPSATPMYSSDGNMSMPWVMFFQALATAVLGGGSSGAYLFTVPGTIGIKSNAAPLIQAPEDITFSTVVGLVKQPPTGAAINVNVQDAGTVLGTLIIPAGSTSATLTLTSGSVNAGDLLTIDITAVGTTFPGSDLTVQLQP